MDYNLLWLLTAAVICGCYNNERNRAEEYQENLAHPVEEYILPKSVTKPAYLHDYGNIITGNTYRLTKSYIRLSFTWNFETKVTKKILFPFSRYAIIGKFGT